MTRRHGPRSVSNVAFEGLSLRRVAAIAIGALELVGVARGQGEEGFFPGLFSPTSGSQTALASADVDGDGRLDVMTAITATFPVMKVLKVQLGDGTGGLGAPTSIPLGVHVFQLVVGDLDSDGDPDVVGRAELGALVVLLSDGAGGFGPVQSFPMGGGPVLLLADVDLDGDLDVAAARSNDVVVLLGNGAGGFAVPIVYAAGGPTSGLASGDLDLDGDLDLVLARSASSADVLANDGAGAFTVFGSVAFTATASHLRLADLDGDLDLDLLAACLSLSDVVVALGDGALGFASPSYFGVDLQAGLTDVVDVDGDGRLDAIAASTQQDSVSVLRGNGTGGFLAATIVRGVRCNLVTLGDLDGDGRHDVIAADPPSSNVAGIRCYRGDGTGGFRTGERSLVGTNPQVLASGDVDGDGRLDLVSAGVAVTGDLTLLLNDGTGRFPPSGTTIPMGSSVALADVDADGDLDLLSTQGYSLLCRLGDGAGGFAPAASFPLGGGPFATAPSSLTTADLDGDGDLDVVAPVGGSPSTVRVLHGDGLGSFGAPSQFATGLNPKNAAAGDVDGDGDLDLVTADNGNFGVSILLNDGTGAFAPPSSLFITQGSWSVALGDLDADGDLDIVVADSGAWTVVRVLNDGAGGFGPPLAVPNGAHSRTVVLGDWNSDLALDAAISCSGQGTFAIHYGDGAGGLGPAIRSTADGQPIGIAAGDFDGDGRLDVATADSTGNRVTVYANRVPPEVGTSFCAGDGSLATACPCDNVGEAGRGCANSQSGSVGALLAGSGDTGPDTVVLTASDMLPTALAIFLQGDVTNTSGVPFGDGVRCVGGQLLRIGLETASGGIASYPELGDSSISAKSALLGAPIPSGTTRWYQTYYRDPDMSFCAAPTGNTWNVTNGIWIAW